MCTTTFLGITVCAVSLLPISRDTIRYGTSNYHVILKNIGNAGATIYDGRDHPVLLKEVEKISNYFKCATLFHLPSSFINNPVADKDGDIFHLHLAADASYYDNLI